MQGVMAAIMFSLDHGSIGSFKSDNLRSDVSSKSENGSYANHTLAAKAKPSENR